MQSQIQLDPKSVTYGTKPSGCTVDRLNVDLILNAVATILHSQLLEDMQKGNKIPHGSDAFFFSEEKYILEKPEQFDRTRIEMLKETPTVENIFEFTKALYDCA